MYSVICKVNYKVGDSRKSHRLNRMKAALFLFVPAALHSGGTQHCCLFKCQVAGIKVSSIILKNTEEWNKARITWHWHDNSITIRTTSLTQNNEMARQLLTLNPGEGVLLSSRGDWT